MSTLRLKLGQMHALHPLCTVSADRSAPLQCLARVMQRIGNTLGLKTRDRHRLLFETVSAEQLPSSLELVSLEGSDLIGGVEVVTKNLRKLR